jgi:acyl phosphate:glycerol-3-phosphate acyltransferase
MEILIILILSYILGSIPFGYILTKIFTKKDIRDVGSKNIGATNVWRSVGKLPAVLTLFLDIFKGYIIVKFAIYIGINSDWIIVLSAFLVILGHMFPIFLKFRGGKGVATACGVFFALTPLPILISLLIFVLIVFLSKYISLGSIIASACMPTLCFIFGYKLPVVMFTAVTAVLIIFKHKANIERLISGTENKFYL